MTNSKENKLESLEQKRQSILNKMANSELNVNSEAFRQLQISLRDVDNEIIEIRRDNTNKNFIGNNHLSFEL